jgi:hypothetical protein
MQLAFFRFDSLENHSLVNLIDQKHHLVNIGMTNK